MSKGLKYELLPPVCLNEQGSRAYNEDYLFPDQQEKADPQSRMFLVCDGVGGSARGDLAARFVCQQFPKMVQAKLQGADAKRYTQAGQYQLLSEALRDTEAGLDAEVRVHPQYLGMATTLTYLHFSPNGVVAAWIGDSRIYHFREGTLMHRSWDHSLVAELVRSGEISDIEARHHPRKNVILRAISGTANPAKLDLVIWQDVQPGDQFLLCTDGIWETFESDLDLADLLARSISLEEKRDLIDVFCKKHARDNYSMYLIEVKAVSGQPLFSTETFPAKSGPASERSNAAIGASIIVSTANPPTPEPPEITVNPKIETKEPVHTNRARIWWLLALLALLTGGYLLYPLFLGEQQETEEQLAVFWSTYNNRTQSASNLAEELQLTQWAIAAIDSQVVLKEALLDTLLFFEKEKRRLTRQQDSLVQIIYSDHRKAEQFSLQLEQYESLEEPSPDLVTRTQRNLDSLSALLRERCAALNNQGAICARYLTRPERLPATLDEDRQPLPDTNSQLHPGEPIRPFDPTDPFWHQFDNFREPVEGMVAVHKGNWGFVSLERKAENGDYLILYPPDHRTNSFDKVHDFYNGVAAVQRGEFWGYITKEGSSLYLNPGSSGFEFTEVESLFGRTCPGYGWVRKGGKKYFLDQQGSLTPAPPEGKCPD